MANGFSASKADRLRSLLWVCNGLSLNRTELFSASSNAKSSLPLLAACASAEPSEGRADSGVTICTGSLSEVITTWVAGLWLKKSLTTKRTVTGLPLASHSPVGSNNTKSSPERNVFTPDRFINKDSPGRKRNAVSPDKTTSMVLCAWMRCSLIMPWLLFLQLRLGGWGLANGSRQRWVEPKGLWFCRRPATCLVPAQRSGRSSPMRVGCGSP